MMTVYNKVINHAALQTLDVLAIGMVTLVALRAAAARAARLHHRPYRAPARGRDRQRRACTISCSCPTASSRRRPSAVVLERRAPGRPAAPVPDRPPAAADRRSRLRRPVPGRAARPRADAGLVTAAAMPVFALLSVLAQRGQAGASARAASARPAPRPSALGEAVTQALTVKLAGARAGHEAALRAPPAPQRLDRAAVRADRPRRRQPRPGAAASDRAGPGLSRRPHDRGRRHDRGRPGGGLDPLRPRPGADAPDRAAPGASSSRRARRSAASTS